MMCKWPSFNINIRYCEQDWHGSQHGYMTSFGVIQNYICKFIDEQIHTLVMDHGVSSMQRLHYYIMSKYNGWDFMQQDDFSKQWACKLVNYNDLHAENGGCLPTKQCEYIFTSINNNSQILLKIKHLYSSAMTKALYLIIDQKSK